MIESYTIDVEGVGPVLIERSLRARHINIDLRPFKGVRIAVPRGVSLKKAEQLAHDRCDWIKLHLAKCYCYSWSIFANHPDV